MGISSLGQSFGYLMRGTIVDTYPDGTQVDHAEAVLPLLWLSTGRMVCTKLTRFSTSALGGI